MGLRLKGVFLCTSRATRMTFGIGCSYCRFGVVLEDDFIFRYWIRYCSGRFWSNVLFSEFMSCRINSSSLVYNLLCQIPDLTLGTVAVLMSLLGDISNQQHFIFDHVLSANA